MDLMTSMKNKTKVVSNEKMYREFMDRYMASDRFGERVDLLRQAVTDSKKLKEKNKKRLEKMKYHETLPLL